ncbi:ImmA/IrrE family metallo-endopeptidase [Staphylococcus gallinarum]|uniref:ImmA/IrrE family metallo-endopeptidase n=1 Tax=Staphylococcus gallinarum TaxID=1293 RepID=UPI001E3690D9|nr:ImmA/IrrE family metallo-endopeptidase [Staphylococcus gallinarum]MCD8920856.1 ImmA/IrrE family metallo-endopeptidase [Staphylococcus gallinarum]UEH01123.1 ImmA/IrrE family metallo-endopeptidase [Staphylococcus gallinarum]
MKNMAYGKILDDNLLNKFEDEQREKIKNLQLSEEKGFFIDVEKICSICDITLKKAELFTDFDMNDAGTYDEEKKTITYNPLDANNRQRFTIAHELGHAILGHEGKSFRTVKTSKYNDIVTRMKETSANQFAANLLMPEKLVKDLLKEEATNLKLDKNNLGAWDVDILTKNVSNLLKVSQEALNYTIKNLNLIKVSNYEHL